MKIIIHTMYFLPEFGSAPILMNEMASYFASKGYKVEVITTIPRQRSSRYKGRFYINEHSNGFRIKRFWTNTGSSPTISRLLAWSIYTLWTMFNIMNIRKGDIVFLRLPPLQLGVTGILASRLKGAKVFLNVQDIHPDLAIESGILRNPAVIKLAKAFERWIYKHSDCIPVISDGFKENLKNKGVPEGKINVIPNWVDVNFLRPFPKDNDVSKRLELEKKFIVMHAGTITLSSFISLEHIIDVAHLLKNDNDIVFAIVGEGMKKKNLIEKVQRLQLSNVKFIPFQPQDDLPYLLAASDILIVPLDSDKSQLSVPSKLCNFMATGRAILGLAHEDSETAKVISESQCGICVRPDNVNEIAKAIINLKNSENLGETFGHNGRQYAELHFAKEKILDIYEDLMLSKSIFNTKLED
jgi:colanic acid biosynthesis glycosyl transferase WcaI